MNYDQTIVQELSVLILTNKYMVSIYELIIHFKGEFYGLLDLEEPRKKNPLQILVNCTN